MKEQKHSYSQRIGKTTFIVNVKQSESAKKPLNTVFQDICKHEVLGGFFTDKSFNLENPQKYLDKLNPEGLSGAILYSLRNSPLDCFSQMLTHLEPRVSCTACNSLIAPYIFFYKYTPTLISPAVRPRRIWTGTPRRRRGPTRRPVQWTKTPTNRKCRPAANAPSASPAANGIGPGAHSGAGKARPHTKCPRHNPLRATLGTTAPTDRKYQPPVPVPSHTPTPAPCRHN